MALRFEEANVGDELPERSNRLDRAQLVMYAGASGDFNPIHWNEEFARAVGLPGVISHGMFTMALVTKMLTDWAGDMGPIRKISVQFRKEVRPDETVVARGRVEEKDPETRTVRISLWAELQRDGETVKPIKNGEALLQLP